MAVRNLGYHWAGYSLTKYGVCIPASAMSSAALLARDMSSLPPREGRLLDPQLYLSGLSADDSVLSVRRLASYRWINPAVVSCAPSQTPSDWERTIETTLPECWPPQVSCDAAEKSVRAQACLQFQRDLGVRALVLPCPLTTDPRSDYSAEMEWLEAGLRAVPNGNDDPVWATVALSDACLIHDEPPSNDLLQIIVDQVSATAVDGVYVVLEQTVAGDSPYISDARVAWALLELSYYLGARAHKTVMVNYADVFGLACVGAGASWYAVGPTVKGRRLHLPDYQARDGGAAYPRFHSHSLIMDLLPKRDLEERLRASRLLRFVASDRTASGRLLLEALERGDDADSVADWQERLNNCSSSRRHYMELVTDRTDELVTSADRSEACLRWLQDAERDSSYLASRLARNPLTAEHRHVAVWRSAFESFLEEHGRH